MAHLRQAIRLHLNVKHMGRFKAQCAEIGDLEALKLRLFLSTRRGATISWYVNFIRNRMAMK
ncbi:unnamed protein product [Prunus armeniaca]